VTLRWTAAGFADIQALHRYLEETAPGKTTETMSAILEALDLLAKSPNIGRKGRVAGTRELVLAPYVIAYRVRHDAVHILAVQHGSRQWPQAFD
jgi:toxin ParE1/3/4